MVHRHFAAPFAFVVLFLKQQKQLSIATSVHAQPNPAALVCKTWFAIGFVFGCGRVSPHVNESCFKKVVSIFSSLAGFYVFPMGSQSPPYRLTAVDSAASPPRTFRLAHFGRRVVHRVRLAQRGRGGLRVGHARRSGRRGVRRGVGFFVRRARVLCVCNIISLCLCLRLRLCLCRLGFVGFRWVFRV